ncbi:hypothetical protein [Streptomyces sp. NPDC040750]|uniref:hypothetical protein n=1 Tax=Streptomyces sp. NPDC040750 TaxID=3154491 RepID=UPI0033DB191F
MSLDVVMHTLSDLGAGRAQDLARLCEIAHVGRLGPEEAALVGPLLGLPDWAVERIPALDPGQAVWKVGPAYVDIIETVLSEDEARLTDTSARRRQAQRAVLESAVGAEQEPIADADTTDTNPAETVEYEKEERDGEEYDSLPDLMPLSEQTYADGDVWSDWEMPPNLIDSRHQEVITAARAGRCDEAAQLAAIGQREDIRTHGITSDQAASWIETRAQVADLCGNPTQAVQLRATVARMGNDIEWWKSSAGDSTIGPARHGDPQPLTPAPPPSEPHSTPTPRRRAWPYVAAVTALGILAAGVWQHAHDEQQRENRDAKAAAYKGRSGRSCTSTVWRRTLWRTGTPTVTE